MKIDGYAARLHEQAELATSDNLPELSAMFKEAANLIADLSQALTTERHRGSMALTKMSEAFPHSLEPNSTWARATRILRKFMADSQTNIDRICK